MQYMCVGEVFTLIQAENGNSNFFKKYINIRQKKYQVLELV